MTRRARAFTSNVASPLNALTLVAVFLFALTAPAVRAQSPTDNGTPLGLAPGSPEGTYALSGFENVNLYNGGLSFSFPVLHVGGRGGAGYTAHVPIDTKWMVTKNEWYDENDNLQTALVPTYNGGSLGAAGYGPGVISVKYNQWKPEGCYIGSQYYVTYRWASVSILFTAPDGTQHELVDQATLGQPISYPTCSLNGNFRGPVFVSKDEPGMTFVADAAVREAPYWGNGRVTGYLKMPDGTVYRLDSIDHNYQWGSYYELIISWIRDPNGNKTTFNYTDNGYGARLTSVKDSLNRQVTIEYNLNLPTYGVCDRLTYKGFGGAERKVHISYGFLSGALRAGASIQPLDQLFPELDGDGSSFDPSLITAVWLPDGDGVTRRYRFKYNYYAELARVELPTGGAIEYDWGAGLANGPADGVIQPVPNAVHWMDALNIPQIYRRLLARRAYDAGNVLLGSTGYGRPETQNYDNSVSNAGYVGVGHYDANGQQLSAEAHYFYGSPATSFFSWQATPPNMPTYSPFPSYRDGREYQTDFLAANGSTLLRRVVQSWDQPALSWWGGSADSAPANCPFVKETVTTLADSGQVTKTTNVNPQTGQIMIDQFGNPLDVWVYGYGQGQPGGLLRHMHTEFLSVNPVNGVDYTNRTSATAPHRLNLPVRMSVYDAGEVERARTTIEYDNYSADAGHAALTNRLNISGLDSSFNVYYTTRGNTTAATRYLLTNDSVTGSITGYTQYDIAGNVVKTIDARGNQATLDYSDRFGDPDGEARSNGGAAELSAAGQTSYGFPTQATNALGHTTYTQYDYYTGKAVDAEDANGTTYSGFYADVLERPTQVISGANRDVSLKARAVFTYDDVNRVTTTTSDFNSFAEASPLKSQTLYDGMGRTTETRRYEGAGNYIATRRAYDALGRVSKASNPFRNGETPIWTTTVYDELSRVTSVTTPDNSVTTNSYSGSSVTVTDPMGKKQKSVSDAFGRVTQVYEDPNGANWLTIYTYDTLDNLIGVSQYDPVSQVTQTRTFAYDSLKRLVSATNPESGTVSYAYDNQGNLLVQTDARGVSSHASYDALNRLTRRWYNGSSSTTATANNSPALPAGVGTSDEVSFFYDSQALPAGSPPGFSRGYATGRLVAVTYGGGSAGDYYGFDAQGRTTLKVQQTGGVNYQTTLTYNNGGARKTLTYPSGHVVNYNYDAAGRLGDKDASNLAMTGNLGDGLTRTYSAGIAYSPFGGVSQEKFGTTTPIYNKSFYNVRGQLTEMRVATTPNDTFWNRGAIINHYSDLSWAGSGSDNNGNLKKQDVYIPNDDAITGYSLTTSYYYYDGVNRLDWTREVRNGSNSFVQDYDYDRFGNRKVNGTNTWGVGATQFSVSPSSNRLGVPAGYYGVMNYDAAGNITEDTYTGQGQRKYDAWNRMTQAWANNQWQTYTYDGNGRRVRRNIYGRETWQVYGIGGELLAEYAANASPSQPQREYGYRNGQMLVSAAGQNCGVGYQGTKTWGATNASIGHLTGGAQGGDWVATAGVNSPHYMSYGPYDNTFGQGHHTAKFLLQVNNNSGSDVVATLDVVTASGATILAQKQIRRSDFTAANQWQWFTLEFDNPCFGSVEARIYWNGNTTLRENQLTVTGLNNAGGTVEWMIADQLGTPRMVADKTGSLAGVSRHDYLPFGEELYAGYGGRTTTQGYSQSDGVRQHFTGYERDDETGLDYAQARYYASAQGRFTGVDSVGGVAGSPQTWNGYAYSVNNPVNVTDPTGRFAGADQSGPSWEVEGYPDWWKRRALWTDEMARAMERYQEMVDKGLVNLAQRRKKKRDQSQQQQQQQQQQQAQQPTLTATVSETPEVVFYFNSPIGTDEYGRTIYFTGYGAVQKITLLQDGKPVVGVTGTESVTGGDGVDLLQNDRPVASQAGGEILDFVARGGYSKGGKMTPDEGKQVWNEHGKNKVDVTTRQTLTVNLPDGGRAQIVFDRRLTNVDDKGNLRPPGPMKDGIPTNYSLNVVGPVTVKRLP